ncbi:hypothetical protein BGW39_006344 [Mortierella sp. 14UC]|nr:hypothetical protein BGW39_006344 [Mortierella sp. 14UC]
MRSTIIIASALALSALSSTTFAAPPPSTDTLYSISDSSISAKCKACVYSAFIDSSASCSKESNPPSAKSATTTQHLQCFENFAKNKAWAKSCLAGPTPPPSTNTTAPPTPPAKKACEQSEVNTFQGLVSRQAAAARDELAGITTATVTVTATTTIPVTATVNVTTIPTITPTANITVPTIATVTSGPTSTATPPTPSIITGGSGAKNGANGLVGASASSTIVVALSALLAMAAAGAL